MSLNLEHTTVKSWLVESHFFHIACFRPLWLNKSIFCVIPKLNDIKYDIKVEPMKHTVLASMLIGSFLFVRAY